MTSFLDNFKKDIAITTINRKKDNAVVSMFKGRKGTVNNNC